MTISITASAATYTGDGSTLGPYYVKSGSDGIYFEASSELTVTVRVDDTITTRTEGVHYTVTGAGSEAGYITFTAGNAPADGAEIRIERNTAKTQTLSLTQAEAFNPANVMGAMDKLTRITQDLARGSGGGSGSGTFDGIPLTLDPSGDEWDAESKIIGNLGTPTADDHAATKAYADTVSAAAQASADAAAASATAAGTSATNASTSESNASTSETNASNSADAAAASVAAANLPSSITGQALKVLRVNSGETAYEFAAAGGDTVGPSSSIDSEIALFDSTTGKLLKRATVTGLLKASSGVLDQADAGTDYLAPGEVTSVAPLSVGKTGEVSSETRVKLFSTLSSDSATLYNTAMLYAKFDADSYPNGRLTFASPTDVDTWTDVLSVRGGNIGIGTTAPDTKLHLDGNMKLVNATLTGGIAASAYDAGTKTSGTYTPDEGDGHFQYAINGGAHTLAPPTNNCTMIVQYTNNGSAGAITTSGFTYVTGAFTTTNGDDFMCQIIKNNGFSWLHIEAMQ